MTQAQDSSSRAVVIPETALNSFSDEEKQLALAGLEELPSSLARKVYLIGALFAPLARPGSGLHIIASRNTDELVSRLADDQMSKGQEIRITIIGSDQSDMFSRTLLDRLQHSKLPVILAIVLVQRDVRLFFIRLGSSLGVPGEAVTEADLKRFLSGLEELQHQL